MSGSARWTLTRLHARYSKDALGEDLVFRRAAGAAAEHPGPGRQAQRMCWRHDGARVG
jgi:hypothetical protein